MSFSVSGGVATITMDHPENRNAITPELLAEVGAALADAGADPAVRVVVLTHTGPAFCAGADLKRAGARSHAAAPHDMAGVLSAVMDSPKPVVARIAGHCAGGGVGLAAAADISIAAAGARFAFSEVRIGVAPAIISVVCLPKLRRADALELFLTGERISAARAAEVGLINRAVPDDELDAAVAGVVRALLAGAPGALAAAKSLVYDVGGMERADAFAATARLSASLFEGEEARAGMAAFARKETPPWVPQ
ncbi:enoyl-CoA hydratase/isomerase family protein [Acidiferrimicrobium sp. IK]|uniref:enoyl-CoA hydratase-related protein n=1 Tax=Acidiferrimicrobium sp. IK TaxID=2871700 RepID=UPI0021CB5648|nr:enoyl-CoA hydratase-related protein [Acidiferrimicrobium sp. IK]MCU4182843.1 enoyl-CoA hydratase/isomerase family protein [Acidiferrimicrobium sp. IK]